VFANNGHVMSLKRPDLHKRPSAWWWPITRIASAATGFVPRHAKS